MLICRLELTMTGSDLSRETVESSVERWDSVWVRELVEGCVGGSNSGRGPRSNEECRGPCKARCDSRVAADGGDDKALT